MYRIGVMGGPGAGKTTTATGVFHQCKLESITVEYISEWIRESINKGWTVNSASDQLLVLKKQREKEDCIPNEIEVSITDSPTLLSFVYGMMHADSYNQHDQLIMKELFGEFMVDLNRYDQIFFINRTKDYVDDGTREQTEEESNAVAATIKDLLELMSVKYIAIDGDENAVENIMMHIRPRLWRCPEDV